MEISEGILLINKPSGITSFDVIRKLRVRLGVRKVGRKFKPKLGHAGTLDPMAEGLMIVGVGNGTKKLSKYLKLDKTYEAEIKLGERTDTGDIEGKILERAPVRELPDKTTVESALFSLVGMIGLPVPAYSAIKISGQRLYKKARKGEPVETPVRPMRIDHIELIAMRHKDDAVYVSVRMDVASGVYVRSVAEEFGRRLGFPATLSKLVRTRIGDFTLDQAKKL